MEFAFSKPKNDRRNKELPDFSRWPFAVILYAASILRPTQNRANFIFQRLFTFSQPALHSQRCAAVTFSSFLFRLFRHIFSKKGKINQKACFRLKAALWGGADPRNAISFRCQQNRLLREYSISKTLNLIVGIGDRLICFIPEVVRFIEALQSDKNVKVSRDMEAGIRLCLSKPVPSGKKHVNPFALSDFFRKFQAIPIQSEHLIAFVSLGKRPLRRFISVLLLKQRQEGSTLQPSPSNCVE